jgi:phage tail P2-like protein
MFTLPEYLRKDENMIAIAESIATKLAELPEIAKSAQIYTRIDNLPEELLDILAYDFKVDWWDPNYTVEQKRQILKDSWEVHRTIGTKHAVVTAISAIYSQTDIKEWYEYSGPPFEFRLLIDASYEDIEPWKHQRVLDRVEYYKNLRSSPKRVEYTAHPYGEAVAYADTGVAAIAGSLTVEVQS